MEIVPDTEEGGYGASFPELPGCITSSETLENILANALDAKKAWIEAALEDGITIPEPAGPDETQRFSGQFKIRMPKSLHRALSLHAKEEGISMNSYCCYLLAKNDAERTK